MGKLQCRNIRKDYNHYASVSQKKNQGAFFIKGTLAMRKARRVSCCMVQPQSNHDLHISLLCKACVRSVVMYLGDAVVLESSLVANHWSKAIFTCH